MIDFAQRAQTLQYYCNRWLKPPERPECSPVTEANMVYELGQTLLGICHMYEHLTDVVGKLKHLAAQMMARDPSERPTVAKAIAAMELFSA